MPLSHRPIWTAAGRCETVHAIELQPRVEFQIGYLKKLPADYAAERHELAAGLRDFDR